MTPQTKIDDDGPPLVLLNCSAMSRQAAMSTAKPKPKRGWNLGWFGGKNNNENKNGKLDDSNTANKNKIAREKAHKKSVGKKESAIDTNITLPKLDKSLLPSNASSTSLSSQSSSIEQPIKTAKSAQHPQSPKSLSPRDLSPGSNSSVAGEMSNEQSPNSKTAKDSKHNVISNGGISPDELSRQKRREEVRQKTAWYEEYIRGHLAEHGGDLSSLNKDELVALKFFDKQRRRLSIQLFGRMDSEADSHRTDDELDQLLILADRCNKAQNVEAELEMLLVQMDNNNEVDMNRLYHLELLSRQRLGGNLSEKEVHDLEIFEEQKQYKEDLDLLRKKQNEGIVDINEVRLRELTLLERKLSGEENMTDGELREGELIEMRREDARVDKIDYVKLLQLKELGKFVDADRLSLLSMIDRRRCGLQITESEMEVLHHYFALREEEYLDRIESKLVFGKENTDKKTLYMDQNCKLMLLEQECHDGALVDGKENTDKQTTDTDQNYELLHLERECHNKALVDGIENANKQTTVTDQICKHLHLEQECHYEALVDGKKKSEKKSTDVDQNFKILHLEQECHGEALLDRKEDTGKQTIDIDQNYELLLLEQECHDGALVATEETQPDKFMREIELTQKRGEGSDNSQNRECDQINENDLIDPELMHQQHCGDMSSTDQLIEDKETDRNSNISETEDSNENKSVSIFDEVDISTSERVTLEEYQSQLKELGLPLGISFTPHCEDDEFDMSFVSFSDETYIKDLLFQKENRESERKEECLDDAFKIYKRTIKKKKLPESEDMLLTMFAKILQQRNKEMRKADNQFDELVEKEVSLYELRRQEAQNEVIEKAIFSNDELGKNSFSKMVEEESKQNSSAISESESMVITKIEQKEKTYFEIIENSSRDAIDSNEACGNNSQQSATRDCVQKLLEQGAGHDEKSDGVLDVGTSDAIEDELTLSKQTTKTQTELIEQVDANIFTERGEEVFSDEVDSSLLIRSQGKNESGEITVLPFCDKNDEKRTEIGKRDTSRLRKLENEDPFKELTKNILLDTIVEKPDLLDGLSSRESNITEANTESVDDGALEKPFYNGLHVNEIDIDESSENEADEQVSFDFLRSRLIGEELVVVGGEENKISEEVVSSNSSSRKEKGDDHIPIPNSTAVPVDYSFEDNIIMRREESLDKDTMAAEQGIIRTEIPLIGKLFPLDTHNEMQTNDHELNTKDKHMLQNEEGSSIQSRSEVELDDIEISSERNEMKAIKPNGVITLNCSQSGNNSNFKNDMSHNDLDLRKSIQMENQDVEEISGAKESANQENRSYDELPEGELAIGRKEFDSMKCNGTFDIMKTPIKEIEINLLYELDLVTRLRKGMDLTEKGYYELDLLCIVRRWGALSEVELEDLKLLKSEREQLKLNDTYLKDLYDRSCCDQPLTVDLLYELELYHKDLNGESLSDDEQIELYLFDRRLNGDRLSEDDLDELNILRDERLSRLPTDHHSDAKSECTANEIISQSTLDHQSPRKLERSISERSTGSPKDQQPARKMERLSLGRSSRLLQVHQSTRKIDCSMSETEKKERLIDDDDSIYRCGLLERQMTGQRLDRKEFRWLQILMKKARNQELNEDDLTELEIMRSQRNESEVDFINTKKLLEEEVKRQSKNRKKEQRRKEKEEKREQQRKEKEEREKVKRMRKRSQSRIRRDSGMRKNGQTDVDENLDALNSHDVKTEILIIGSPPLQPSGFEKGKKEESKMGVFGGIFGLNSKKQRQEQQLKEAKRLQAELIKHQMKALALENEAEELEREKVMQEQLVQETIEKKRAASTIGSSIGSSSWDISTAEDFEESDSSSSWTSWDSSSDDDSSHSEGRNDQKQNEKGDGEKIDVGATETLVESSRLVGKEVMDQLSNVDSAVIDSSQVKSATNYESTQTKIFSENGSNPLNRLDVRIERIETKDERQPKLGDVKNSTTRRSSSLGFHLKKKKKKRTKHGDDMSLGTLQLSKSSKEGSMQTHRNSQKNYDKETKSKDRPWILNDQIGNSINNDHIDKSTNGDLSNQNEKSISESDSFQFNHSFVSRISEGDDEDEEEEQSLSSIPSGTDDDRDASTEEQGSVTNAEQSLLDSLANSFTSIGHEAYDLGLQEYKNIESRLGGKVKDKQAEFDHTWETTVADENVIAQINQRLRERQRVREVKREKKKERKERNNLKEVPRLFLFEGERVAKNGRKRKKKKKMQKKLNRTFTKEFRKAMNEVFDSDSDSDDEYQVELEGKQRADSDDMEDANDFLIPPFSPHEDSLEDDDVSDPLVYSETTTAFVEESNNSDDDSVKFDGEYLKRLQARSLPSDLKRMLSGRSMVSSRNLTSTAMKTPKKSTSSKNSDDNSFTSDIEEGYLNGRRRPRRKKTGEIVDNDVDPAEVYGQELEKQKREKTFTITGIRKEMEAMRRSKNFAGETDSNFGNFDVLSPSRLNHSKARLIQPMKKKLSLGKGVESLERQRPRLAAARSLRSLGTTFSDEALLTGNRGPRRRGTLGLGRTPTIEEDEGEGGVILRTSGVSSDDFDKSEFSNQNPGINATNSMLPNLNLFGALKKPFKGKKPTKLESADGGGLLNGAQNDDLDTSESRGGVETDESIRNMPSFGQREPLPLPVQDDDVRYQRGNKMFEKVIMKGVLSKLKLPGKNNGNRKFGGSMMMDDDVGNNFHGGSMAGQLL